MKGNVFLSCLLQWLTSNMRSELTLEVAIPGVPCELIMTVNTHNKTVRIFMQCIVTGWEETWTGYSLFKVKVHTALLCFGLLQLYHVILSSIFMWDIYPYTSGLIHWYLVKRVILNNDKNHHPTKTRHNTTQNIRIMFSMYRVSRAIINILWFKQKGILKFYWSYHNLFKTKIRFSVFRTLKPGSVAFVLAIAPTGFVHEPCSIEWIGGLFM